MTLCAFLTGLGVLPPAPAAQASPMVNCTYGPVASRLEVNCTNIDWWPATVNVAVWCTDLADRGVFGRMAPRSTMHITRECGPGAHPIVWFVNGMSDREEWEQEWRNRY